MITGLINFTVAVGSPRRAAPARGFQRCDPPSFFRENKRRRGRGWNGLLIPFISLEIPGCESLVVGVFRVAGALFFLRAEGVDLWGA
jgi:hypothetical protein